MSLDSPESKVQPYLAQFVPEGQQLWIDYLTPELRKFRVRLKLFANGEKLRFVDLEERPFDRNRPYFDQFPPDIPVNPNCDQVDFFRRVTDSAPGRGVAVLVDPQRPASIQSVEGWRIRHPHGPNPDRIYLVLYGERRLIPNLDTYRNLFGTDDYRDVHLMSKNFKDIPEGDPLSPDAGLWRFPDDPSKIYLFDTAEYHWIKSADVLKQYGFDHAVVREGVPYVLPGHVGSPLGPL